MSLSWEGKSESGGGVRREGGDFGQVTLQEGLLTFTHG